MHYIIQHQSLRELDAITHQMVLQYLDLPEHVDRFFKSAKLYSMKMQFSKKEISDAIVKTVKIK